MGKNKIGDGIKNTFKKVRGLVPTHIGGTGYGGLSLTNLPKDELEKAHFIGYVKFLKDEMNKGHSMLGRGGQVTKEDIDNYEDYLAWYNEFVVGEDEDGEDDYADEVEEYEENYKEVRGINNALTEALSAFDDEKAQDYEPKCKDGKCRKPARRRVEKEEK